MAVASSPASKQKASSNRKVNLKSPKKKPSNEVFPSPAKRNSRPGVRVVGSRIYDSSNGKTCHQCRQKTMDFAVPCKNQRQSKPCLIKFCHKCLLNRYGEKAEEVAELEHWNCPKCRGICNCSLCMKKRGHQPTGILVHTAKATGFSSVSEMLLVKGSECFGRGTIEGSNAPSEKELVITSRRKRGKENSCDGNMDSNSNSLPNLLDPIKKEPKHTRRKGSRDVHDDNQGSSVLVKDSVAHPEVKKHKETKPEELMGVHGSHEADGSSLKLTSSHIGQNKPKKIKHEGLKEMHHSNTTDSASLKKTNPNSVAKRPRKVRQDGFKEVQHDKVDNGALLKNTSSKKHQIVNKILNEEEKNRINGGSHKEKRPKMSCDDEPTQKMGFCTNALTFQNNTEILLPRGNELSTVGGVDLLPEDVGNALQFLEFCAAFGKILNVRKGQPESVLRDLMHGRSVRSGKYSLSVQFHIQLLSFIQKEMGESPTLSPADGKNSWLCALKNCMSQSQGVLKSLPFDFLGRGAIGYETLEPSKKLQLLNFLCDEVLGTLKIRNWIDDQNSKFLEKVKKAKEKVIAAKDKERRVKQKIKDEVAKAIIAKDGAPLSISEHEAIMSQIKSEAAVAYAELLGFKGMLPEGKCSAAVRTETILLDSNGRAYWRLKSYSDMSNILRQDVEAMDGFTSGEKWFAFDDEQEKLVDKCIKSLRKRMRKPRKVYDTSLLSTKAN